MSALIRLAPRIHNLGYWVLRLGTALILLWIGAFKFTPTEAAAIAPLMAPSPFTFFLVPLLGVMGASYFIGTFEIVTALLLLAHPRWPRLALWGGIGCVVMSIVTLSFLLTVEGMFGVVDGLYVPTGGAFVLKDLWLLGAGLVLAADSLLTLQRQAVPAGPVAA